MIKKLIEKYKLNKIRNRISKLQHEAMLHQRNGKLREYAMVTKQITELEKLLVQPDD